MRNMPPQALFQDMNTLFILHIPSFTSHLFQYVCKKMEFQYFVEVCCQSRDDKQPYL